MIHHFVPKAYIELGAISINLLTLLSGRNNIGAKLLWLWFDL